MSENLTLPYFMYLYVPNMYLTNDLKTVLNRMSGVFLQLFR